MNTKSLQSVLKEFDNLIEGEICCGGDFCDYEKHSKMPDKLKAFLIHSIADLLEGEGIRIIGEDERQTRFDKDHMQADMIAIANRNQLRAEQKAHLAEVVLKIRKQI